MAGEDYEWTDSRLKGAELISDTSFFMHYKEEMHKDLVASQKEKDLDVINGKLKVVPDGVAAIYTGLIDDPTISDLRDENDENIQAFTFINRDFSEL